MKKFTFLLTLLLSCLGVNAQDVFQASDAPGETTWAANTTWYKMTLKNGYVVKYDVDENNYLYAKLTEAYGENSWWCLVGNETTGYKLYNKAAGVNKVLGVSKMNQDGKARAEMCDVNDATHGTFFLFNTKNSVNNVFYCKEKTSNEYINQRDNYLSNWTGKNQDGSASANGDAGSAIRFYKVKNTNADIRTDLTKAKEALQAAITQANTIKDESKLGYYKESVISSANTTANNTSATANDMRSALSELKLKVNQPQPGVIYRVVSAYDNFKTSQGIEKGIYAFRNTMKWGDVDCTNPSQYWVFETASNGFYMKNAANHTYVSSATTLQNAKNSVVTIAWPLKNGVPVANLRTNKDKPFHAGGHAQGAGKTDNLMAYGVFGSETGGASAWNIVPATVEEIKTINANTISSVYTPTFETTKQMGTYVDADVKKLTEECKKFVNISTLEEAKNAFENLTTPSVYLDFDANKYYRFVNVGVSKALGTNEDKAYATTNNNSNVDLLWQVIASTGGKYNIKHANSGKYLQSVQNGEKAKTALGENESNYELRNTELGVIKLYNGSAYPAQVETNQDNTNYLNGWDGNNAKWKVFEVNYVEVPMKAVGDKSYASVYLPFGVSTVSGAEAYVGALNAEKTELNMTKVEGVPAEKGFVLVGTADKATLTISNSNEALTIANDLVGTNTAITLADDTRANYLVFGKNKDNTTEVGFFKPSTSVPSIPANKAYLDATTLTASIAMNFGGNTTGVNTVVLGENGVNAPVFDLSGRRVVAPVKGGVYIQNGKKFIK